jgi:hypothetical protein
MTLLAYRLRPLPIALLVALPVMMLAATWWLAPRLGPEETLRWLQFGALLMGLATAFTVSRDVDAPEQILVGAPHPFWRTPATRAALWLTCAWADVGLMGGVVDARGADSVPLGDAVSLAHADLVFVAGIAFVVAIRLGSFFGGAAALTAIGACGVAQRLWAGWPLRVVDPVGAPHWEDTRTWLLATGATCLGVGLLYLRGRGLSLRRRAKPPSSVQSTRI